MTNPAFKELTELSEKIALELVFAEAGKDLGLLPINSLLTEIEQVVGHDLALAPLAAAAQPARRWLDAVLETSGTFDAPTLQRLGTWVPWWQATVRACENHTPLPAAPAEWEATPASAVEASPVQAAEAPPAAPPAPALAEEPALTLNLEQDGELLGEFINESQEHLQTIEQSALTLEANPSDVDTLNAIFRAFHTLKGCAGFLNITPMQTLAHQLESLLDLARQQKLVLTPAIINLILEGGDRLKQFVTEIRARVAGENAAAPIVVPTQALLASIRQVLTESAAPAEPPPAVAKSSPAPTAPTAPQPAPATIAKPVAPAPSIRPPAPPAPAAEAPAAKSNAAATAVKVDTQKLDGLVDLVGEMVIAQSLVVQSGDLQQLQSEQLNRNLALLGRITKDLQRTVMSLRMVPIRGTFQKMHRLVRDATAKLGKKVDLVTEGEDTELDRTIVEEISDPLVHMVRNAVDHGIELPAVRQQRGKPETGRLLLRAYHQGGNIVIEIQDDGNGLNRERILAKGQELGLVQPNDQLSDEEVYGLIMAAGFSTAEKVTDLSGRGVGMDVVRRNIEKLRGKIEIKSVSGQGSTFRIYLPLTLAIIDGLLVGVGDQRFILPTLLVRESFRPAPGAIHTVQGRGEMVSVRGHLTPLLRLYDHLGIQPASTDPTQSLVIVVEAGSQSRCVLVDRLLGKQEVVIKSLGETFRQNRAVAGAAILGDGRVGLILDPQALVHLESSSLEAAA